MLTVVGCKYIFFNLLGAQRTSRHNCSIRSYSLWNPKHFNHESRSIHSKVRWCGPCTKQWYAAIIQCLADWEFSLSLCYSSSYSFVKAFSEILPGNDIAVKPEGDHKPAMTIPKVHKVIWLSFIKNNHYNSEPLCNSKQPFHFSSGSSFEYSFF